MDAIASMQMKSRDRRAMAVATTLLGPTLSGLGRSTHTGSLVCEPDGIAQRLFALKANREVVVVGPRSSGLLQRRVEGVVRPVHGVVRRSLRGAQVDGLERHPPRIVLAECGHRVVGERKCFRFRKPDLFGAAASSGCQRNQSQTDADCSAISFRYRHGGLIGVSTPVLKDEADCGMGQSDSPLAGLHVVEVANWAAVPCAAALLGELGAEVIKIEPPTGDGMRGLMQPAAGDDSGIDHPFQFSNRGKRSVALDLRTEAGSGVALDLMAEADVVLLNLVEERRQRMGLTPEVIHARNPSAVIGILTGFGDVGPERNTPGFDLTSFFARSGLSGSVLGPDGGVPRWRAAQGDHVGGLALFGAVMTALFARASSGEGSVVSTSLLQAASWSNAFDLTRAAADGRPATPRPRTRSVNVASEAFECADGRWIQLCMAEPVRGWAVLCDVLGRQDLFEDPRFVDVTQRFAHMAELVDLIAAELRLHDSAEVLDGVRSRGGAAALVATTAEVVADPQVDALGLLRPVEHEAGSFDVIGSPFNMWPAGALAATPDREPVAAFGGPGADSRFVLREVLGLSDARIDELIEAGVVTEGEA